MHPLADGAEWVCGAAAGNGRNRIFRLELFYGGIKHGENGYSGRREAGGIG